ncbi:L,D-transpeptidase [Thiomicrospira sp. ALE5]|uniref:L,D-transpeptidase n=1 Tax=Thiomicrospira sp. ALE5 TaxID=748650 RepID=UPI0008EB9CC3|nr:L,D-transpeptidase [Thiomicrospira sp. ALE5]SFR52005.1 L,D-transpeptidase catalytic domain [Thiomicrospira sp. ALE5]
MQQQILIHLATQQLQLIEDDLTVANYPISSAKQGVGQQLGSMQTPLGEHYIRAKIGAGAAINSVFVGRRPTGEIYSAALAAAYPHRDWILTRIMWLCGCQPGFNRLGSVDSFRRYIYIHGTPDSGPMGRPASHGCIRMRNTDVVSLFDRVRLGTTVSIQL